ncbi:MAG: hypothetical protein XXXJIFNMEKO3_02233 [Candidatus Erwinia impunctatus]
MPIEIRQLVIKSKTINDEGNRHPDDADKARFDFSRHQAEKKGALCLENSANETRER